VADNFTANPGSGGSTFAADDIGGVLTPRVKAQWGADGTCTDASVAAPLPIQVIPMPNDGCDPYRVGQAGSINAGNIKATGGTVYAIYAVNLHTAVQYLKFWNKATTAPDPSADTASIAFSLPVPASSTGAGFLFQLAQGIKFSNGIGVATTGVDSDSDETAVTASTLKAVVFYK
jgi:hypothetical protein